MGTRADFYMGRGPEAEWLGSIAFDGYIDGIEDAILAATDPDEYRSLVAAFIAERDDGTTPEMGWPWPWNSSHTTDYAYGFDGGVVYGSRFGGAWFVAAGGEPVTEEDCDAYDDSKGTANHPDMSGRSNVTFGPRSGLTVISATD